MAASVPIEARERAWWCAARSSAGRIRRQRAAPRRAQATAEPRAREGDLAGDVLRGVEFLKSRKEIDPRRIGLIGHSEGGMIAPLAAV